MAKQTINLGTGELTGDGESIRSAFDKINDNFTETYNDIATNLASAFDGDYNSLSNKPVLFSGDYNDLTNQPTLFDGAYNSLSGTPTTLAGYGITDAATSAQGALADTALQAETISLTTLKTEVAASADFADFQVRIAAL